MQSPPSFSPPARKSNNTVLIVILVILGVLMLCCGGFIYFGMTMFGKLKGFIGCTAHYEYAYKAINQYVAAKHKYPDAKTWQDEIAPYYVVPADAKGQKVFDMGDPSKDLGCPADDSGVATGMAFNSTLAGKKPADVPSPETILLFEVPKTGRNLSEPYKRPEGRSPQSILGKQRPWFYITADGQGSMRTSTSSTFSSTTSFDEKTSAPPDLSKNASGDGAKGSTKDSGADSSSSP